MLPTHMTLTLLTLSILFLVNILDPIPKEWQRNGKIEFQDVTIQYQPESSPVLQNINMMVKPGQKVLYPKRF